MRIRRAQREIAKRRMMHEVPKADVVIINPTHFAVALRYDEKRMRAPHGRGQGRGLSRRPHPRDRDRARRTRSSRRRRWPARCSSSVEIGSEIPTTLYVAVAQVLTYIYQLRTARTSGARPPEPPAIDPALTPHGIDHEHSRHDNQLQHADLA